MQIASRESEPQFSQPSGQILTMLVVIALVGTGAWLAHEPILEVILSNIATLAGHVDVHDWVIMGGLVAIPQFTRLGKGAFLGGFSAMRLDLPPFFRYSGRPAEPVGVNHVGMTRRGIPEENIRVVRKAYRILYRSGLVLEKAMEQIQEEFGSVPEVQTILEFVAGAKKGIARPTTTKV